MKHWLLKLVALGTPLTLAAVADFDLFQVTGGTANGFSSPGSTTLTRQSNGSYKVDSSFNVGYSITFKGAAGGHLAGYEGTTKGTVKMSAVGKQ